MSDFTFDLSDFRGAVDLVVKQTGKDQAVVVNRAALHTIIGGKGVKGAIQRTPKASKADINKAAAIVLRIAIKRNSVEHLGLDKDGVGELAKQILKRRLAAMGYTAGPGWTLAARAFGGRGVKTSERFEESEVKHGGGVKAHGVTAVAEFFNTAPAAEKIGQKALQDALDAVVEDMLEHQRQKLQAAFDKVKP
jgi:hypothetical protein